MNENTTSSSAKNNAKENDFPAYPEGHSLKPLQALVPFLLRYPARLALTLGFLLIAAAAQLTIPIDRKSTRLNSSQTDISRMPPSA